MSLQPNSSSFEPGSRVPWIPEPFNPCRFPGMNIDLKQEIQGSTGRGGVFVERLEAEAYNTTLLDFGDFVCIEYNPCILYSYIYIY